MNIIQRLIKREIKAEKEERKRASGSVVFSVSLGRVETSCEDSGTRYITLPDGLRLIIRNGEYVGWYVCGER